VGPWIWAPVMQDKQTCRLWRSFEIPFDTAVKSARLRIAVDNGYRLMLDGRELGAGSDWRSITEYDVSLLLRPGRNVFAVEAFNDNREAGMQFGLRVELKDKRVIEILSDSTWRVAPQNEKDWEWKREPPPRWVKAVMVSSLLPRGTEWLERAPTMVVKVPLLQPVELHFWQRGWFQITLWVVVAVIGLLYLRVVARLALQSKAQDLLRTERARIARDIHDELGARLTELALEGEVIQTELPAESSVRPRLEALCEKARAVSGAMDEVVWMVNSRRDTLRDFATYVCKHTQRYLASTPISCRLDVEAELPEVVFELPLRRNLLLGVKEALNNAVKYSGATELFLRIRLRGQTLFVLVEDNGAGFDLEHADPVRNGLANMNQRMKDLGGQCRISTSTGAGCLVEFQVPLPKFSKPPDSSAVHENQPLAGIRGRVVASGGQEVSSS
jgi:signal transduction histidine kinase